MQLVLMLSDKHLKVEANVKPPKPLENEIRLQQGDQILAQWPHWVTNSMPNLGQSFPREALSQRLQNRLKYLQFQDASGSPGTGNPRNLKEVLRLLEKQEDTYFESTLARTNAQSLHK